MEIISNYKFKSKKLFQKIDNCCFSGILDYINRTNLENFAFIVGAVIRKRIILFKLIFFIFSIFFLILFKSIFEIFLFYFS